MNPNVQSTSGIEKKRKLQIGEENSSDSAEEEQVLHSFKSNKSAQSAGSSDQLATATLVSYELNLFHLIFRKTIIVGN